MKGGIPVLRDEIKETILKSLTDDRLKSTLTDELLNETIQHELEQGAYGMDGELLDACVQILNSRHSSLTEPDLDKSQRRIHRQLKRIMKRSATQPYAWRFPLKAAALAALVVLLILSPIFFHKEPFQVAITPDQEQYRVVGIGQSDIGSVRASTKREKGNQVVKLDSFEAIPHILGYRVALPQWVPEGCTLESVSVETAETYDEVMVTYAKDEQRINIVVSVFESHEGAGISFEQTEKGQKVLLENGSIIYVASNLNSAWGIHQDDHMDYFIDVIGLDEGVVNQLFNSIGGTDETK